jgi:hypothetical protein
MPITPVSTSDLVQRVRDLLGDRPLTQTSTTTDTGTTIAISDGSSWSAGDVGEFQSGTVGYEQFLVTADPVANNLTVLRGYGGTTAETHTNPSQVVQNPTFFGRQIRQALDDGVRGLWPYVYRTEDVNLTPVLGKLWYDVTAPNDDALGIVSVTQIYGVAPSINFYSYQGRHGLRFDPEANTAVVPSGQGLYIPYLADPTGTIIVKVMEAVKGQSDIEDNSLFPVADCLVYLAAGRLTGATEIPRVAQGGDLESSTTVGTGARAQAGQTFGGIGQTKLQQLGITYYLHYKPLRVNR